MAGLVLDDEVHGIAQTPDAMGANCVPIEITGVAAGRAVMNAPHTTPATRPPVGKACLSDLQRAPTWQRLGSEVAAHRLASHPVRFGSLLLFPIPTPRLESPLPILIRNGRRGPPFQGSVPLQELGRPYV